MVEQFSSTKSVYRSPRVVFPSSTVSNLIKLLLFIYSTYSSNAKQFFVDHESSAVARYCDAVAHF
jgi:hypothetical protein